MLPNQEPVQPTAPVAPSTPSAPQAAPPQPPEPTQPQPPVEPIPPAVQEPTAPRDAIYERYYGQNQEPSSGQEPAQATPAPPSEPAPAPSEPNEEQKLLERLQQQVTDLSERLPQPQAEPTTPPTPPKEQVEELGKWIDLYREGNYEDGAKELAAVIDKFSSVKRQEEQQNTMLQTVEMIKAQSKMEEASRTAAAAHPELAPLQKYIDAAVERALAVARQEGKVKTYGEYAELYTAELNAAVKGANEFAQSLRAAGNQDAMVRSEEVVSTSVIRPQATTNFGEAQTTTPPTTPVDPFTSYIDQRKQAQLRRDGMVISPGNPQGN